MPRNNIVVCTPPGCLFGNSLMAYLFARAHAERCGAELRMKPSVIHRVFAIEPDEEIPDGLPRRSELDVRPGETGVDLRGYAQNQKAMIYTAEQAREWLPLRLPIDKVFDAPGLEALFGGDHVVAHIRRGDFAGYGYPLVSEQSYHTCVARNKLCWPSTDRLHIVSDASPTINPRLPDEISFLPDWYRLLFAPVLLRGNSSFSWTAALLGTGRVFAPVVAGLKGGVEHECEFVEGNWPALSDRAGATDLHAKAA